MSGDFWLSWWYHTFILMSFIGLAVWVVNQGFLSERNRKWGTKEPLREVWKTYCPDTTGNKGGRNSTFITLVMDETQQVRMLLWCCGSAENGVWEAQHTSFGGCRSALWEMLTYFPAAHFWFSRVHSAQSAQSLVVTSARETRAVYRHSLRTHTQQSKPDRLAIFHTATVTGSQNTWVIYSLLAAQSQAGCFPNNMKTLISPYRTQSKIGEILLEQW